ncbi:DNA-directed RNA polymerase subunit RPC12/RpoP [Fontibacillus solani]|uniref:DNA-directed RNA polymerase subunit RPC12/RpoP n=1 Tax=Fontibacillus solani TaxID=1572857 RepID=A0A7W3XPW8_9BACL|nr:DNA-directed RNA polymerase subunit RPC12/RpoP [Fontibacillus solani]
MIDYKCPNCGSSMVFDSETGMLSCQYCGRKDDIRNIADPPGKQQVFSGDEVQEYHCTSCGAVIMTEAETAATVCSFCGSAVVLGDRLSGKLAPAMVIPFSISKEEAMQAFKKWCKNGLLTPSGFMTADRIKGIMGMYVPFWLYELHNKVDAYGHATKVRTYTKGDYRYTETQHFDVYRRLRLNYSKIPIDASEKMNDELMDKLEPFPYDQLKGFKTPYLAGYVAEKYSYNDEQLLPRAKDKISGYIESAISASVTGYSTVNFTNKQIDTKVRGADYTLLPVWVVHYDYNKKDYTFAMNGQTGKVVGKPPISKAKVMSWFAGVSGVSLLLLKLVSLMMGGGFL